MNLSPQRLLALASRFDRTANAIVVPKGARRAEPEKIDAILAAANIVRATTPGVSGCTERALLNKFGTGRFEALAEVLFEAIRQSKEDSAGKLVH